MNIRVDLQKTIYDGTEVVFRSPVDCSQITGLIVYYKEDGITASKEFAFADAHGNNVGDIDHLFAENVVVKVILDLSTNMAFVQNADTNAYLEGRIDGVDLKLPQDMTPEQQAQARTNIGAASMEDCTAFYVLVTETDGKYTANKTFAEVQEAYLCDKAVYAVLRSPDFGTKILPLLYWTEDLTLTFDTISEDVEAGTHTRIFLQNDGSVTVVEFTTDMRYLQNTGADPYTKESRVQEMTKVFYVTVTEAEDGTYTADKTFAEVKAAYDSRRSVMGLLNGFSAPVSYAGDGYIEFSIFSYGYLTLATLFNNGVINIERTKYATTAAIGDIETALDELHTYAQALIGGETA